MKYRVRYTTSISVVIDIDRDSEDDAADDSWDLVQDWLNTVTGSPDISLIAEASLDGVGEDSVEEVTV